MFKEFCCFFFLGTLLVVGPNANADEQSKGAILRIGAISVLTGEGASWGVNHQRGALLAVQEFNARGGINGKKIEVEFEDSPNGLARNAVSAYSKLASGDGMKFILGPVMMDELLAIAPMAKRDGVFLSGSTYMPNAPSNFFTTWIDADIESDLVAAHVFEKYKRVAILASEQSWESQIAHRFKGTFTKLGGEIVSFEEPSFETNDVKTEVLKVKQQQPEAIFITSYLLLPKYIRAMKALGLKTPIFSVELDQSVIDNAGDGTEGLVFIAPSAPSEEFVRKFKERWGVNPDIPAANSYDAAGLLFKAISERGDDVTKVIAYFSDFHGYDGATGHIERRAGKTVISTSYYAVKHGKIGRLD
jgi:branched-chain amino acid transport system substrate-binding protein